METVTIKQVFRDPVDGKFGPGTRTTIKTEEYPEVRMSSFAKGLEGWNVGDKVMIEITKNGQYTNFKPGDGKTNLEARVDRIEKQLGIGAPEEKVIDAGQQDEFNDF